MVSVGDTSRILMMDDASKHAVSRSQYGNNYTPLQPRFSHIGSSVAAANVTVQAAPGISYTSVAQRSVERGRSSLETAKSNVIIRSGAVDYRTTQSYNLQSFPQYVPGQMPFDFLSMPLVPYLESGISNLRPQLGSLPAPRGPVRVAPFPYQPSWTDQLVEEMKRDPTWDSRLSFVAMPPGDPRFDLREDTKGDAKRDFPTKNVQEQRDREKIQQNAVYDSRLSGAAGTNWPKNDAPNRDVSPTIEKEQQPKSPPTPRVLNPKPVGGGFTEEVDKSGPKNDDPRTERSRNAAAQPVNREKASNPPRNFVPPASKGNSAGGTPNFGKPTGQSQVTKPVKKDNLKSNTQSDSSKDPASGGGLAARLSAYMQATKNG